MSYCISDILGWTIGKEGNGSGEDPLGEISIILTGGDRVPKCSAMKLCEFNILSMILQLEHG